MTLDLREYLAAERTLLAYARTGIAVMGIGFVIARFNLMLRILPAGAGLPPATGHALWLGTAMVLTGAILAALAGRQYQGQVRDLNGRLGNAQKPSPLALATAFGLGLIGVVMAAYLIVSTR